MQHITIIGASGAIGRALVRAYEKDERTKTILALSRSDATYESAKIQTCKIDILDETSIANAASKAKSIGEQSLILIATGFLHDDETMPEKSIRDLSFENFEKNFAINTIAPAMIAKHFLPSLSQTERSMFACLSARVGSISDNHLGGWYAYRASKAALNMTLKNLSIEAQRRFKKTIITGLHPGTVDSSLSEPFQARVPEGKLFNPDYSAQKLKIVLDSLNENDSGKIFAWDGSQIDY